MMTNKLKPKGLSNKPTKNLNAENFSAIKTALNQPKSAEVLAIWLHFLSVGLLAVKSFIYYVAYMHI